MAGHNKWSKIKHIKAIADKKKGKEFSKVARLIMQAAREGGADPALNLKLKYALDRASKANMPKDNVDRAVKKGIGDIDGAAYEETSYEGYGPSGVAILVEVLTDNKNRTVGEVRKTFDRRGGNLGTSGCVSYLFDKKGLITVPGSAASEDQLIDLALEAGAENVEPLEDETFELTMDPQVFETVLERLESESIEVASSEITMIPQNTIPVARDEAEQIVALLSDLDDLDDVQDVHSNADIPDLDE